MDELKKLQAERNKILLTELGVMVHDLGKLSQIFIGQSSDFTAHSQILGRMKKESDLYCLHQHIEICMYLQCISQRLHYLVEPDRRSLKAILDTIWQKTQTGTIDFDQAHQYLLAALDKDTQLESDKEYLMKYLNKIYQKIPGLISRIRKGEKLFFGIVSPELLALLEDAAFESFLEWRGPEDICQMKRLGDFIALHHENTAYPIPHLVRLLCASTRGVDGFDSWIDKQNVQGCPRQKETETYIATAFGYEPTEQCVAFEALPEIRANYATILSKTLHKIKAVAGELDADQWYGLLCVAKHNFRDATSKAFRSALGETRRPANDVTLWDHSYSTASLYKAALVKVLLENKWTAPQDIGWQFLRVAVDGRAFWGDAHHVTDILGRRAVLTSALDRVRRLLEIDYPVGNEIYRDENGSIFIVPALEEHCRVNFTQEIERLIVQVFQSVDTPAVELAGEVKPYLIWYPEKPVRKGGQEGFANMVKEFGQLLNQGPGTIAAYPHAMLQWWQQTPGQEICTVCGVRPAGYKPQDAQLPGWVTSEKAAQRHVCCVCLARREQRAKIWLRKNPTRTIWAGEVCDVNGRLALVVGNFDLLQWLDGTLVETLRVKGDHRKNASPARIRRIWETTRNFWEQVQKCHIPQVLGTPRPRLTIKPHNKKELARKLGGYHTYDLDIGCGQTLGVIWDPQNQDLIIIEYLQDIARRLLDKRYRKDSLSGIGSNSAPLFVEAQTATLLSTWLIQHAGKRPWRLLEPSGYRTPAKALSVEVHVDHIQSCGVEAYIPHISLLTEPSRFMALVPADRAMDIIQVIQEKYEREMNKVRDRLPLHLGVVITSVHTPFRVVLEAGRSLLDRRSYWKAWNVKSVTQSTGTVPAYLSIGNQHFAKHWHLCLNTETEEEDLYYGAVMGDGECEDNWYTYLLTSPSDFGMPPADGQSSRHVKDIQAGQSVYLAPATFDFEFLDTTARRFEINYDASGRRCEHPTRPYRLAEVRILRNVWKLICSRLTNSQWMALDSLIETKRQEWYEPQGAVLDYSATFKQFVCETLQCAEWKWQENGKTNKGWRMFTERERRLLKDAVLQGIFHDAVNLYHEAMKCEEVAE